MYVVLDEPTEPLAIPGYTCLDVGESSTVRTRVSSHERKPCWRKSARGRIVFAVLYLPGAGPKRRRWWEAAVRSLSTFLCGANDDGPLKDRAA